MDNLGFVDNRSLPMDVDRRDFLRGHESANRIVGRRVFIRLDCDGAERDRNTPGRRVGLDERCEAGLLQARHALVAKPCGEHRDDVLVLCDDSL